MVGCTRAGFGLVEVIVAMTLLAIGIVSVGAGAAFSTRVLRTAENEEDAVRIAESILDSLMSVPQATSGSAVSGRFLARWESGGSEFTVTITPLDGAAASFSAVSVLPPVLDTLPSVAADSVP